jgi:hypothetical protein
VLARTQVKSQHLAEAMAQMRMARNTGDSFRGGAAPVPL